tara:strand:- start:12963 stop:13751 length:789 start_codon:yes stop_codon:yes gene_type:complete
MSVWGKLLGGSTGLLLGGPLGAVLGLAVGHGVDKIRKIDSKNINKKNFYRNTQFSTNDKQMVFATGVIVLSAKLAKADGQVTKDEIETFKSVFDFDSRDETAIGKIYNEAKLSADGFEIYASQLKQVFGDQEALYVEFITSLFKIAFSDGLLHPKELEMINKISNIFGIPKNIFESIQGKFDNFDSKGLNNLLDEDYKIFSCNKNDTDKKLKDNYLKLVKDYHPDNLVSKGLPEEFIRFANQRLSEINNAYDRIEKSRNKKI